MKTLLIAFFGSLLVLGCESPDLDEPETLGDIIAEAKNWNTFEIAVAQDWNNFQRLVIEGHIVPIDPNEGTSYTGWVKELWSDQQIKELRQFKKGNIDGLWISWYENGQKKEEGRFKEGKKDGLWISWYENGQKGLEYEQKNKKKITALAWKPNGEKCMATTLKNGHGVVVYYDKDGTETRREKHKDGKTTAFIKLKAGKH